MFLPPAPPPLVDLGVTKTVSAETVKPGDNLVWTIDARNCGPGVSTNFTVADVLPSDVGLRESHDEPDGLTCTTPPVGSTGSIICTAAPATVPAQPAPGSAFKLTIVGQVSATSANGAVLSNLATVSGTEAEPIPDHASEPRPHGLARRRAGRTAASGSASPRSRCPIPTATWSRRRPSRRRAPPPPPAGTTIALTKVAHPTHVPAGGNVTFTLTVTNTGDASAPRRQGVRRPAGIAVARLGTGLQLAGRQALPFRRDARARRIEDVQDDGARVPGRAEPRS